MNDLIVTPLGTVSPYCKGDKNCPGFLVEYKGQKYLLDCGNGITRNMDLIKDLQNLKIFISHLHPDHYGDIPTIAQAALVYKKLGYIDDNIEIYLPNGDKRSESIHFPGDKYDYNDWGHDETITRPSVGFEYIETLSKEYPIEIKGYSNIDYKNDDLAFTSLKVPHQISSYAFRIDTDAGSIGYSGDTGPQNNLKNFFKDVDLFICESTYLRGQARTNEGHLFAYEAAKIAKDANAKMLLLTHFWPETDKRLYLEEAKQYFENVEVAEEGKQLVLRRK